MVVDTLGLSSGGRPRRTGALANFSGQSPLDRSGAVSRSKPWGVERSFPSISFSHADNAMPIISWRPDQDYHVAVKEPDGNKTIFAIVFPVILNGQSGTFKYLSGSSHVQPSGFKSSCTFYFAELNRRLFYVTTINSPKFHWPDHQSMKVAYFDGVATGAMLLWGKNRPQPSSRLGPRPWR